MLLAALLTSSAFAATPRGAAEAPELTLEEAVARASAFLKEKNIDVSQHYLEAAEFDRRGARPPSWERCWKVRWQMPRVKGGLAIVHVCEDGRIELHRGE